MAASVLAAADEIAIRFDARVIAWRAIEPPQEIPPAAHTSPDGLDDELVRTASESLSLLVGDRARITLAPPKVIHGEPWRAIVDIGKTLHVDLIVIGSHAYGGWDRLLGTTAAKVVNHADRNVLVVHSRAG